MLIKILSIGTLIAAVLATGCGLAIHFKWVGEIEATPHLILAGLCLALVCATALAALAGS